MDAAAAAPFVEVRARTQVTGVEPDPAGPVIFETERRLLALKAELDAVRAFSGGVYQDLTAQNAEPGEPWSPFGTSGDPGNALVLGFAYDAEFPPQIELALTFWAAAAEATGAIACGGDDSSTTVAPD